VLELDRLIGAQPAPWWEIALPPSEIPGMITEEERRYYEWIGRWYTGAGAVIELGPWFGRSTTHIVSGLGEPPAFAGHRLQVYDDFVWRSSWMDEYYAEADRPANGASFQAIFERFAAPIADRIDVHRARIVSHGDNDHVAPLTWSGGPIEIAYIDCGRTFEVNEAWYALLEPSFLENRTLLVMQDWQLWKEQPPQEYNQTKIFTDSKGPALDLIHELAHGAIGTFLYRGP
jgi:hypothetical protein